MEQDEIRQLELLSTSKRAPASACNDQELKRGRALLPKYTAKSYFTVKPLSLSEFSFLYGFSSFLYKQSYCRFVAKKKNSTLALDWMTFFSLFFAVCLGNKSWETKSMQSLHYFQTKCVYYMLPVCIMKRTDTKSAIMTTARQRILSVCNSCA